MVRGAFLLVLGVLALVQAWRFQEKSASFGADFIRFGIALIVLNLGGQALFMGAGTVWQNAQGSLLNLASTYPWRWTLAVLCGLAEAVLSLLLLLSVVAAFRARYRARPGPAWLQPALRGAAAAAGALGVLSIALV